MNDMLLSIFVQIDDFCKKNIKNYTNKSIHINQKSVYKKRIMTVSKILTLSIYFSMSHIKNLKYFYEFVKKYLRSEFQNLCSYNNFVELKNSLCFILEDFITECCKNNTADEIYFDAFPIKTCHNKHRYNQKSLKSISKSGKSTMGWFHGRKAYIWLDFNGNLACFRDTFGNTADNNINEFLLNIKNLTATYIYADKGFMFSLNNANSGKIMTRY